MSLTLVAWNVNQYEEKTHAYMKRFLEEKQPDVLFLSETKMTKEYLTEKFSEHKDYKFVVNAHLPKQWHGVAFLVHNKHTFEHHDVLLNLPLRGDSKGHDATCGRVLLITLNQKVHILGTYIPNAGNTSAKYQYRTEVWDPCFRELLRKVKENGPTVWLGDINVAPGVLDVSSPGAMATWPGFTPLERDNFEQILEDGWVDVYRKLNSSRKQYSWRGKCIRTNYGMRLDNILVTPDLQDRVTQAEIWTEPTVSDHVPIAATFDL